MRIGIFFGGPSREREISFAGGRTVYDNLDRALFEPVPIFVDSLGNFIKLDWSYIYKGSIRDFYPPQQLSTASPYSIYVESLMPLSDAQQLDIAGQIGELIPPSQLSSLIDFAFLALHGNLGEDGKLQGLLEALKIPYTASGILPSALGMNKVFQKTLMQGAGFNVPKSMAILRHQWQATDQAAHFYQMAKEKVGLPFVTRPANQGSSIGVRMLWEDDFEQFSQFINDGFFSQQITATDWKNADQLNFVQNQCDLREYLGYPLLANKEIIHHPQQLQDWLNQYFQSHETPVLLEGLHTENEVLIEEFLEGREFSCIVIRTDEGEVVALPPTEILKGKEIFDYRSKYLPGLSRKVTPIDLPLADIERIQQECNRLFEFLRFHVYARIDGFIKEDGRIYLNDPNTTSGMLPSSFFFHQAAEIGLNPSQFLTFIINSSLKERQKHALGPESYQYGQLDQALSNKIKARQTASNQLKKIGIVLGGYSAERHISVESGRNIYEKLAASDKYEPIPIFLTGNWESYQLHQIPINLLLKDNADDITEKLSQAQYAQNPIITKIKNQTQKLQAKYAASDVLEQPRQLSLEDLAEMVEGVFIALHGRPGEDGKLQSDLEKYGVPYNGSGVPSSQTTIDKYKTNQLLKKQGISVTDQMLVYKSDWQEERRTALHRIESNFDYPLIAKPVDDGCSAAVKKINNVEELTAFAQLIFRESVDLIPDAADRLNLLPKEEFPQKKCFLIEKLVTKEQAKYFLEITGGLMTFFKDGKLEYEIFQPSETLKDKEILSLEEKFLAGEGQNITPARYTDDAEQNEIVSTQVRKELGKVAQILNIEGYARIDAFVRIYEDGQVETIIIEINSLPGMTPATCIFHQTALNGYKPYDFIDQIIEYSFERFISKSV